MPPAKDTQQPNGTLKLQYHHTSDYPAARSLRPCQITLRVVTTTYDIEEVNRQASDSSLPSHPDFEEGYSGCRVHGLIRHARLAGIPSLAVGNQYSSTS